MRRAKWTITLTLALVFMMSAAVFAQQIPLNPTKIPQFVDPLPTLFNGLPVVINSDLTPKTSVNLSICEFTTNILPAGSLGKGTAAPATSVWGYIEGACPPTQTTNVGHSYLGPAVVAVRNTPTEMNFFNRLPDTRDSNVKAYTTSTDQSLIWGDPLSLNTVPPPINLLGTPNPIPQPPLFHANYDPELNLCWDAAQAWTPTTLSLPAPCLNNYGFLALQPTTRANTYPAATPAAVHIHGGEVPAVLDGGPDSWWTGNGIYGHGYYSKGGFADAAAGKATYVYPNFQEAAPVWFHDHMLGATRLNVYAGIAGAYVLIDPAAPLAAGLHPLGLSDTVSGADPIADSTLMTVPMIIQDRMFDTMGQLYFPNLGINLEHPFWIPEFVGDTIVVNGKAWPYMNVQPKRYRFLFLNGSNARSYELFLQNKVTGVKGPAMWVIGNDQGYLETPQKVDPLAKLNGKLVMMPGERYEVIIDFSTVAGQTLTLINTAPTPYPAGANVSASTTGRIVQFRVGAAGTAVNANTYNPATLASIRPPLVRLTAPLGTTAAAGVTVHKTRRLTLNEVIGAGGPLEILVNNTLYDGSKVARTDFTAVPTEWNITYYSELPYEGETELWEIVNLTADAHPMHPHLVAFQILNRQGLDVKAYTAAYTAAGLPLEGAGPPLDYNCGLGSPARGVTSCVLGGNPDPANIYGWQFPVPLVPTTALVGLPIAPAPQEIGWKDTVMVPPNMVTRFLVRFAKPTEPIVDPVTGLDNSNSIGYDFDPGEAHGYVWHCHIVDHEDNEMMRPYKVQTSSGVTHTYKSVKVDPVGGQY